MNKNLLITELEVQTKPSEITEFSITCDKIQVGTMGISIDESGGAQLKHLFIDEGYRRNGFGKNAVRYAEEYANSRGAAGLFVEVKGENTEGSSLLKKLGYTAVSDINGTVTYLRDHLNAVQMEIDGVQFYLGEAHDFSFLKEIGRVFRVFDAMDSGNICFGAERDGKRYFVKYAGAKTMDYSGSADEAVERLKASINKYKRLEHPYLIKLIKHGKTENGYAAIFDWVDGEGLRSYWNYAGNAMWSHPDSPNYRFRHLPMGKRIRAVEKIMEFHFYAAEQGFVSVDFYDGSIIYDFETDGLHICDIDFYREIPAKNDMGRMWGSARFMSLEEFELGAQLDEVTIVYHMGAAAFELLKSESTEGYEAWCNGKLSRSFEAWGANYALYRVAEKAASPERQKRFQTLRELIDAWNEAKALNEIEYRALTAEDIAPDTLKCFNRYQKVKKYYAKTDKGLVVSDCDFVELWNEEEKRDIAIVDFREAFEYGGAVFAAYDGNKLIGFSCIDGRFTGSRLQYIQLVYLHISYEYRGQGIGKTLFRMAAEMAAGKGAEKLYISASSAVDTQRAYRAIGCILAEEETYEICDYDAFDIQMEYILN